MATLNAEPITLVVKDTMGKYRTGAELLAYRLFELQGGEHAFLLVKAQEGCCENVTLAKKLSNSRYEDVPGVYSNHFAYDPALKEIKALFQFPQSDEEKAIELLQSKGYKVTRTPKRAK